MPRTLSDIFTDNPDLEVLEVVSSNDGGAFGLSANGRKLKILEENFARQLAELPDADTETGHITDEGYSVHAGYSILEGSYKASVHHVSK